ncbi:hypothetical protein [Arenimonas oryziterrae]|uniref:STAS/SEC14 domain-containing protein n=1 Tax=Arenimonas oryziterrae DSM 21050 = YC6267 TaxID=1121015 RepID=A0A091B986_9GAMM|nr:hypothetical protein [Arenimonas oryziterrae]KFN40990.1 hypothetical protein N789_03670 [Arenimonas oryziterrae DSM 21050 = YC6267]
MSSELDILIAPHPAGLRVRVRGEGSLENTIAYWQAILAEVRTSLRKPGGVLLIDEMSGDPLSAGQWQSLVEAMRGQGLEQVRIAHVKPQGLQLVEYCQIYASEAGLDAQVFEDEGQADLWLRHGER